MTIEYYSHIEKYIKEKYVTLANDFKTGIKRINRQALAIKHTDRSDVLFKTITREIRKVYLKTFAKKTKFLRVQRYRDSLYYLTTLINFVTNEKIHSLECASPE